LHICSITTKKEKKSFISVFSNPPPSNSYNPWKFKSVWYPFLTLPKKFDPPPKHQIKKYRYKYCIEQMLYYRILAKENANISNRNLYSFDSSRLLWHLLWLDGKNWHNTYYKKKRILLRNYYFVEKSTLKRLKILPVGGRPWCKGSDPPECTQVPHKGGQAPVTRKVNKKEKITVISKSLLRWF